jgi:hypothetical protein
MALVRSTRPDHVGEADLHRAFTLPALGALLLRVARIQSSATEACTTNATANAATRSVPNLPSVGSAMVIMIAGKKIRRAAWRWRALWRSPGSSILRAVLPARSGRVRNP